jgi:putative PEP-CTERM system TPR-repeat lipoprotein
MFGDMMPMGYGNHAAAVRALRASVGAILLLVLVTLLGCSPAEDSAARLERAQALEAAGDVRAAAFELRRILQDDPDHPQARFRLGRLNVLAGRGDAAQRELRRAMELGMPPDEVMPWLIDALLFQERFTEARTEVSSMLSAGNPSDPRWLLRRAEANLGLGQFDESSADLDMVADYGMEQGRVWIAQAQLAHRQGDSATALDLARKAAQADPDDPRTTFTQGWLALRQALFHEAESAFLESAGSARARANDTDLTRANLLLVEARLGQDKTSEAEAVIEELETLLGDIPELSYLKGLIAYRKGDFTVARDWIRDTLQRRPEHHPARLLAGGTAFALNEYEEASRQLRRYLAVVPANDAARRLLAVAQARLGRHGEAMAVLEPLRAAGQDAESAALLALIGRSASVSGEFETAESAFREALVASPGDPALRGELARLHAAQGRYDEAIDELSALVREGDAAAELFLVRTLVASGNVAQALSQARALAERSPERPEWHTLVGLIQLQQGERPQGRASLIKALNVDDGYLPALLALGRLGLEDGNEASAERYFNAVLRIEPRHGLAMLGLAESAGRRGDVSTAESWLKRAVEANPDAVLPRLWLSRFHAQSGNADAAISTAREAVAASPRDPRALALLAELQARNGDLDGAADTYGMLIDVVPDDLTSRLALARIAAQQGREGEARQHINAALEVAPRDLRVLEQAGRVELVLG